MIEVITDTVLNSKGQLNIYQLGEEVLQAIEKAGMLPPKSLDTVHFKKDLVKGYSIMFEWDDE